MLDHFDAYLPYEAEVIERIQEHHDVFTLRLQLTDPKLTREYSFLPGQFNMIYLYGVGEVPMSIVNDRNYEKGRFEHTIQIVGRLTLGMAKLKAGDRVGIRGPFGTSWPISQAQGKNIIIVSGGLGNAPLVAVIEEILHKRNAYKKLYILHGMRSSDLLIYENHYERWNSAPDAQVMMATSHIDPVDNGKWKWKKGFVTNYIADLNVDFKNTVVMTVGPEVMMKTIAKEFEAVGVAAQNIYLSLERSMKCAIGHCGRCQLGTQFICKDGPVYPYSFCRNFLEVEGL